MPLVADVALLIINKVVWVIVVPVKEFLCIKEFSIPTTVAPPFTFNIVLFEDH